MCIRKYYIIALIFLRALNVWAGFDLNGFSMKTQYPDSEGKVFTR